MQVTKIHIVIETRTAGRKDKVEVWHSYGDNGRLTPSHVDESFAEYLALEAIRKMEDDLGIRKPETEG